MMRAKADSIAALAITVLFAAMILPSAFAIGGAGPYIYIDTKSPLIQKVVAGESAGFNLSACVTEFSNYEFNITVGLANKSFGTDTKLNPLPDGFKAMYPKEFSLKGDGCYAFPLVIKTPSETQEPFVDVEVLVTNIKSGASIPGIADLRLYISPLNTPLGAASTVFYEGFDSMSSSWVVDSRAGVVRAAGSSPGAQDPKFDYPGIASPNWFMQYPYVSLQLTKNAAGQNVSVSRSFSPLNSSSSSFIAEYAMKSYDGRINFTFSLLDSAKNAGITTKLSEGNITVQNKIVGTYQFGIYNEDLLNTTFWHKFRLEANATSHTFRIYLDNKYADTLPLTTSSLDRVRVEVACPGLCTGYVDDIFLEKITGPPNPTSTTSSASPIVTTTTSTITTTQTSVLTSAIISSSTITRTLTTTLSTAVTRTTTVTSAELPADPSAYAWAISATVAAVVLAAVLLLQRRGK